MSTHTAAQPQSESRTFRKDGLRTITRLLEEQMDDMGLSETQKNAKIEMLAKRVEELKSSSRG